MVAVEDEASPVPLSRLGKNTQRLVSVGRRALGKPPRVVARRLLAELAVEVDRVRAPARVRNFRDASLLEVTGAASIDALWTRSLKGPFPFLRTDHELAQIESRWPAERARVIAAGDLALARQIDVLGTGLFDLGRPIDWHRDWKTGRAWPLRYGPRIDCAELDEPSDVKVPWEISRVQWLLPAGQAYRLTGDERFAAGVREVLEDWIRANPYALGVNWAIAMEAAIRIFSWSWLLHACGESAAWSEPTFRGTFLRTLYLHGEFVERRIERSELNGNHYTADAAGLAMLGLVLGVPRWSENGWSMLCAELSRQVHPDGVNFEASAHYHRLVGELFALTALLRQVHGLDVPEPYVDRLQKMARFTEAYTGPDGLAPLWGDADDGRALPLGGQDVSDHGSFPVLVARLAGARAPGNAEGAWLAGPDAVAAAKNEPRSAAFADGGAFVLRGGSDHVFVDCGPVGLAGRGGHGHNDCLSFEATLADVRLVRDSGSYVYTASPRWRNLFRSTSFHSTPMLDGEEQNRIDPTRLWTLTEDARPELRAWSPDRFVGAHTGYRRLSDPVTPVRTVELDCTAHRLVVVDEFEGTGDHRVQIPLQLAPMVVAAESRQGELTLSAGRIHFRLRWSDPADWRLDIAAGWVSPSYGVKVEATRLEWTREGPLRPLRLEIGPEPE